MPANQARYPLGVSRYANLRKEWQQRLRLAIPKELGMLPDKEVMSQERFDHFIDEAARAAGYEEGFGVRGCDLSQTEWWAAYTRQSRKEQAENDRLVEYLFTCARLAKQKGVIVPREYILSIPLPVSIWTGPT